MSSVRVDKRICLNFDSIRTGHVDIFEGAVKKLLNDCVRMFSEGKIIELHIPGALKCVKCCSQAEIIANVVAALSNTMLEVEAVRRNFLNSLKDELRKRPANKSEVSRAQHEDRAAYEKILSTISNALAVVNRLYRPATAKYSIQKKKQPERREMTTYGDVKPSKKVLARDKSIEPLLDDDDDIDDIKSKINQYETQKVKSVKKQKVSDRRNEDDEEGEDLNETSKYDERYDYDEDEEVMDEDNYDDGGFVVDDEEAEEEEGEAN